MHDSQVILMDHVDWLDLKMARELAHCLAQQVSPGGRVIWRSAALCPPYARLIRDAGFEVGHTWLTSLQEARLLAHLFCYSREWLAMAHRECDTDQQRCRA